MTVIIDDEAQRYPIGQFKWPTTFHDISRWISTIEEFPFRLIKLVSELSEEELTWSYRKDGWSIRQIIHHCADSHMQSLTRFKWALTEESPTIKAYHESLWAELSDSVTSSIAPSLSILDGLHERWVCLLNSLTSEELDKEFIHPEIKRAIKLKENIALYAWHCNHHFAHIELALEQEGKYKSH
ncbi:MAG: putative metal-dependent hydrolase [Cyclobacteriaceae bacterium]